MLSPETPSEIPQGALRVAGLGLRVHPLRGKHAILADWPARASADRESIQGQRGSDACFRVACILRDEGKTPEEALEYMLEWNKECAMPPWTLKELMHKIRDSYAKLAKGC